MGITYKTLGQSNPAATTATTLYTAPANTQVIVSSIYAANRDAASHTIRIWVAVAAAGDDVKQNIAYDETVGANAHLQFTGVTLGPGDLLRVYASAQQISFNAFGAEIV